MGGTLPAIEYFAGHFDGEGCLTMSRHNKGWRLEAKVSVSHFPVLEAYRTHWGGFVYPVVKTKNKRMWRWTLNQQAQLHTFLTSIDPFIMEKRPQFIIGLEWLERRALLPRYRVPASFIEYGAICAKELSRLKHVSYEPETPIRTPVLSAPDLIAPVRGQLALSWQ